MTDIDAPIMTQITRKQVRDGDIVRGKHSGRAFEAEVTTSIGDIYILGLHDEAAAFSDLTFWRAALSDAPVSDATEPEQSVEELADWLERELWVETHSDLCGCRDIDTCDYAQRLRSSSASPEWYVLALQRRGALATRPAPSVNEHAIRVAVQAVLWNTSNYPKRAQAALLGENIAPLTGKVVDAVLAALSPRVEFTPDENGEKRA